MVDRPALLYTYRRHCLLVCCVCEGRSIYWWPATHCTDSLIVVICRSNLEVKLFAVTPPGYGFNRSPTAALTARSRPLRLNPLTPSVAIWIQLLSILCQTGLSRSFCNFCHLSIRVPGCQNLQMTTTVWDMMLYNCTHMATVGVKGLTTKCPSTPPPPTSFRFIADNIFAFTNSLSRLRLSVPKNETSFLT